MNIEWTNADALSCEQTTKIRYIEAIEAEAAIKDLFADMPRIEFMGNRRRWREENEQYLRCLDVLRSLPTANVRENVHAKWIVEEVYSNWSDWTNVRCPVCRRVFEKFYRSNFCPNCGADMRGEQDGEIH